MTKLIKFINTSFTNLIRRDLARERKICEMLHHAAASIKLSILTYLLQDITVLNPAI